MLIKKSHSGFSMIELLIGLVIGLIISGAVLVFIAATLKANTETVQSMKLNHELRALSEIIVRDVRRARGMQDPLANIGSNCDTNGSTGTTADDCAGVAFRTINNATASCILYGYDSPGVDDFRAIRLVTNSGVGSVQFARDTTARTCNSAGIQISSDLLDIESLTFANCTYLDGGGVTRTLTDCFDITVSGKLINDTNNIVHTYTTSVGVRSGIM